MEVGSLVVCINADTPDRGYWKGKPLTLNEIYTIRFIRHYPSGKIGLLLEEIHNPIKPETGREWGYWKERFKEIQPPMNVEIEELLEQSQTV